MTECYLVGYDGSDGSKHALAYAEKLAQKTGARLVIAGAVEWNVFGVQTAVEMSLLEENVKREVKRREDEELSPIVKTLSDKGIKASVKVLQGSAANALCDLAKAEKCDGIIIGRRGQSLFKAVIFGSVASSLVQVAPVPVTVVP